MTPSVVQSASAETASVDDDAEPPGPEHFGGKDDLQFQKAIEVLKQKSGATTKAARANSSLVPDYGGPLALTNGGNDISN